MMLPGGPRRQRHGMVRAHGLHGHPPARRPGVVRYPRVDGQVRSEPIRVSGRAFNLVIFVSVAVRHYFIFDKYLM